MNKNSEAVKIAKGIAKLGIFVVGTGLGSVAGMIVSHGVIDIIRESIEKRENKEENKED